MQTQTVFAKTFRHVRVGDPIITAKGEGMPLHMPINPRAVPPKPPEEPKKGGKQPGNLYTSDLMLDL